jgi:hypothetical protein
VPQAIPDGLLVTVPVPAPLRVTVSAKVWCAKVAVTDTGCVGVSVHVPVPLHAPLQPVNTEPPSGTAIITIGPSAAVQRPAQSVPHRMSVKLSLTMPPPSPALLTVTRNAVLRNAATTSADSASITVHVGNETRTFSDGDAVAFPKNAGTARRLLQYASAVTRSIRQVQRVVMCHTFNLTVSRVQGADQTLLA